MKKQKLYELLQDTYMISIGIDNFVVILEQVVEVFKRHPATNFLISNKFQQTILHIVLKAGYYNKIGKIKIKYSLEIAWRIFQTYAIHIYSQQHFCFDLKVVHGDESAYPNINTVYALFDVTVDENDGPEKDSTLVHRKNFPKKGVNY